MGILFTRNVEGLYDSDTLPSANGREDFIDTPRQNIRTLKCNIRVM